MKLFLMIGLVFGWSVFANEEAISDYQCYVWEPGQAVLTIDVDSTNAHAFHPLMDKAHQVSLFRGMWGLAIGYRELNSSEDLVSATSTNEVRLVMRSPNFSVSCTPKPEGRRHPTN